MRAHGPTETFVSLRGSLDTTTPGGKLIFHVFGAVGEFERVEIDIIRERILAGLEAARARGRKGGRKSVMDDTSSELPLGRTSPQNELSTY